ncbi:MAG TPA: helix-turn-helix transcriptional regulator [Ignavibacteria bacterium]|jgi:transcriptional regulator with XRE-family HTH domain|nr:helix-turn-helix transcriptional regulator [Ignavibacteria bacterium]
MNKKEYTINERKTLKTIGERIRYHRLKQNISQEELSYQSSLDRAFVGRVERGENNISILSLLKISQVLGIEISALLR